MSRPDLVAVPGGTSLLGSDQHYPEERPAREVTVEGFSLARTPTTVAQYAQFVAATGYRTRAERELGGAAVFTPPRHPVPLRDPRVWWTWTPGASWSRPEGPGSTVEGRGDHPVTQVVLADALAYCAWAGLRLPREREWEHAARGGLHAAPYAWGDEPRPGGEVPAVVWRGEFPWRAAGPVGTCAVGTHAANGFGLLDVIGNVWELVDTGWSARHPATPCCAPPAVSAQRCAVAKGGSYLCSDEYCARYRPAARIPVAADSPSAHIGFRCAS